MIKSMLRSFVLLIFFTLLLGIFYPLVLSGIGKLLFPKQANGSLVEKNGIVIGSSLIAQDFVQDIHFHGRPTLSDASNAPLSKAMFDRFAERINTLQNYNFKQGKGVPVELIMDSGSTVDPDISPEGAYFQISRISKATGISEDKLQKMIDFYTKNSFINLYGQKRVNVLTLNLEINSYLNAIERLQPKR
ncbi:MAG TPA: potassium-transporting ATPase subunit C [Lentisphaeria bacterium]|nr:MAG: hypothetical protein A2X47_05020 [Lentisphaerae bacterium GWF2_38_69]HBM14825.1 potassium-transporting ATPase subunit C [Lentisphaeria bacterium]